MVLPSDFPSHPPKGKKSTILLSNQPRVFYNQNMASKRIKKRRDMRKYIEKGLELGEMVI